MELLTSAGKADRNLAVWDTVASGKPISGHVPMPGGAVLWGPVNAKWRLEACVCGIASRNRALWAWIWNERRQIEGFEPLCGSGRPPTRIRHLASVWQPFSAVLGRPRAWPGCRRWDGDGSGGLMMPYGLQRGQGWIPGQDGFAGMLCWSRHYSVGKCHASRSTSLIGLLGCSGLW